MGQQGVLCVVYSLAAFIRYSLSLSAYQKEILNRIEINTPLNGIKRVIEGITRLNIGVSPYSSDVFHEPPPHLQFYTWLINSFPTAMMPVMFIIFDIITAHALYIFARRYMFTLYVKQEKEIVNLAPDAKNQLLKGKDLRSPPMYVAVVFLFNPYTIFNCVAMTTTTINNLVLAFFFIGITYGCSVLSIISLVFASVQTFYPAILISPLYLSVYQKSHSHKKAILTSCTYLLSLAAFFYYCKYLHNGWGFLQHTYGFILQVNDQQPNIGVFWYFFMEMFEHFRLLFLCSYQMNVTILYFIPLTLKFRKDPPLLAACFVMIIAIFKSYPAIGDFAFVLALLPCWKHLYNCMQQIFISIVAIVVTTALAPVLWDLWIHWGAANANFFFGATLAFVTAHIFLVTDIGFAITKRDYLLRYGNCRKINGKDAKLVLE